MEGRALAGVLNDRAIEMSDDAGVDEAAAALVDVDVVEASVATLGGLGAAGTVESRVGAGVNGVEAVAEADD